MNQICSTCISNKSTTKNPIKYQNPKCSKISLNKKKNKKKADHDDCEF